MLLMCSLFMLVNKMLSKFVSSLAMFACVVEITSDPVAFDIITIRRKVK